ncbi:hypothetical protein BDQ12DRAFT_685183 [Crucibulum laeve]|uniref:Uncharacterized protein n=1 Tax=Crucibulum laeve TaxID=68775 RepID=A0A5C3LXP9_9AGAR|nr:hypothetical protein BDQ12DRAFT_685183 [Crucibulum laeve]
MHPMTFPPTRPLTLFMNYRKRVSKPPTLLVGLAGDTSLSPQHLSLHIQSNLTKTLIKPCAHSIRLA